MIMLIKDTSPLDRSLPDANRTNKSLSLSHRQFWILISIILHAYCKAPIILSAPLVSDTASTYLASFLLLRLSLIVRLCCSSNEKENDHSKTVLPTITSDRTYGSKFDQCCYRISHETFKTLNHRQHIPARKRRSNLSTYGHATSAPSMRLYGTAKPTRRRRHICVRTQKMDARIYYECSPKKQEGCTQERGKQRTDRNDVCVIAVTQ